jgi:hypothetical protein
VADFGYSLPHLGHDLKPFQQGDNPLVGMA